MWNRYGSKIALGRYFDKHEADKHAAEVNATERDLETDSAIITRGAEVDTGFVLEVPQEKGPAIYFDLQRVMVTT